MAAVGFKTGRQQAGFSFIEMLIATVIVMAALGPAIGALQSARLAAETHSLETDLHYRVLARSEDVLAESFESLLQAAATAGGKSIPSSYSDPAATADRIVVYLSIYDISNNDNDGELFTMIDPDLDGDNNLFTGKQAELSILWVRVEIPGTTHFIETLTKK
ncbi:MAG: prepilin-type N-terminal cleavage/methylation domain-containing protein [Gammaproteobacteria bacterium]|nr:prepilin-type N-terminal cleavage/methylation domain-containing protein [Gammaproteobacteria bacterium]